MKLKRILLAALVLSLTLCALFLTASAATIVDSGSCGQNDEGSFGSNGVLHWTLDSEGTLRIEGKGGMMNYGWGSAPWPAEQVKKVVVGEGVTTIGDHAFVSCHNLTQVSLPESLVRINEGAFHTCSKLKDINIPESVTEIRQHAFYYCASLESVTIPEGVTELHGWTFGYCDNLKSVSLPDSLTVMGQGEFTNCYSLETIKLPENLTSMDELCFGYCASLQSIEIPASFQKFGDMIFHSCSALEKIVFRGKAPNFSSTVFANVNATAYYPMNNSSWTTSVRQNYGGNITWEKQRPITVTTQPKTTYTKLGATAKVPFEADGNGLTYQWYIKENGATKYTKSSNKTNTYKMTMSASNKDRYAYCLITDVFGETLKTNTIRLRMAATITQQPVSTKAAAGEMATVKLTAAGDGLTYTWYQAAANATTYTKSSTFTGDTYSIEMTEARNGRKVYCVVKDKYGKTEKSNVVTLGLVEPPVITTQPKTAYAKQGATAKVTVKAEGDGLSYQWYIKNAGETKYSKSSVTKSTYSTTMNSNSKDRLVYCVVTNQYGASAKTETVRLRMAATITTQPVHTSAPAEEIAKVNVKAVGDGLTYKWYYKDIDGESFKLTTTFTGNSYSAKMNESRDGRQVYCVVEDKYGKTAKSDVVTLGLPLEIVKQPATGYAANGKSAKVSVKAEGDGLAYQWYFKNVGSSKYSKSSVTKSAYSATMNTKSKDRYVYCVVSDQYGNSVKTKTVRLRMTASISAQPEDIMVASGSKATATVKALGDDLSYQWYIKNAGATKFSKSSVTSTSYSCTMNAKADGRQAYCVVADKYGYSVKTNTVTLSME